MNLFLNWELGPSEKMLTTRTCGKLFLTKLLTAVFIKTATDFLSWLRSSLAKTCKLHAVLLAEPLAQIATVKSLTFMLTPTGCLNLILVLTGVIFSKVNPDNCLIWLQLCFALFKKCSLFSLYKYMLQERRYFMLKTM